MNPQGSAAAAAAAAAAANTLQSSNKTLRNLA